MATESRVRKEAKPLAPRTEELHTLRKQDFIPLEDSTASQSSVSPAQAGPNWQLCAGAKTSAFMGTGTDSAQKDHIYWEIDGSHTASSRPSAYLPL